MADILLHFVLLVIRCLMAVVTLLGDIVKIDIDLTNGLFTSKALLDLRDALRRRRHRRPGTGPGHPAV